MFCVSKKKINDPCLALWNQNLLLFIAYLVIKIKNKWYAVDTWMKLWTDFKDNPMLFVSLCIFLKEIKNDGQFTNTVFGFFYSYLLCFIFIFVAFGFNHFYFIFLYFDCVWMHSEYYWQFLKSSSQLFPPSLFPFN